MERLYCREIESFDEPPEQPPTRNANFDRDSTHDRPVDASDRIPNYSHDWASEQFPDVNSWVKALIYSQALEAPWDDEIFTEHRE